MKNLLNLTESEKTRILNLHKSAIKKEFLFEQRMDAEGKNVEMYNNDKDYDYKKEGDKYFFKLKATPVSEKAKALLAQKKFINWTEAKSGPGLDAIKKLPFQAVAPKPEATDGSDETFEPPVQTTNTATAPTTGPDAVTGNQGTAVTGAVTPATSLSNTQTQTPPSTATYQNNGPLPTKSLSSMTVQNNVANQQLATGPVRSGQEIRQDYRQQQRQERQGARQERRDTKQIEKQLKDLQATYQRLQGKMTPNDKLAYENQIKQLKTQLGQQG